MIFFVYRDEVYNEDSPGQGIAEIIIRQARRNGPDPHHKASRSWGKHPTRSRKIIREIRPLLITIGTKFFRCLAPIHATVSASADPAQLRVAKGERYPPGPRPRRVGVKGAKTRMGHGIEARHGAHWIAPMVSAHGGKLDGGGCHGAEPRISPGADPPPRGVLSAPGELP